MVKLRSRICRTQPNKTKVKMICSRFESTWLPECGFCRGAGPAGNFWTVNGERKCVQLDGRESELVPPRYSMDPLLACTSLRCEAQISLRRKPGRYVRQTGTLAHLTSDSLHPIPQRLLPSSLATSSSLRRHRSSLVSLLTSDLCAPMRALPFLGRDRTFS